MDIIRIVRALRLLCIWAFDQIATILGIMPMSFWFTCLQRTIESGYITRCSISPFHLRTVELVKIVMGLFILPGATSTPLNFTIFTYLLATVVATQRLPCATYGIAPPFRVATWDDITNLRIVAWPSLIIFKEAQSHFNDDLKSIVDNLPRGFAIWCTALYNCHWYHSPDCRLCHLLFNIRFLAKTPHTLYRKRTTLSAISWSKIMPIYTNIVIIRITFAVIAPLILFWATITMALFYLAYQYNILFISDIPVNTCGLVYPAG